MWPGYVFFVYGVPKPLSGITLQSLRKVFSTLSDREFQILRLLWFIKCCSLEAYPLYLEVG